MPFILTERFYCDLPSILKAEYTPEDGPTPARLTIRFKGDDVGEAAKTILTGDEAVAAWTAIDLATGE